MKNLFFFSLIVSVALLFSTCGKLGGGKYDIKTNGFERIISDIKKTVGDDGMVDEIVFSFDEKNKDKNTEMEVVTVDFQSKADKNKLQRGTYTTYTGWGAIEPVEITLVSGNPENFNLDDEVNSINLVKADALKNASEESVKMVDNECNDPVFSLIKVLLEKEQGVTYNVSIKGSLKSNGVKKSFNFTFDKDGNLIKK